MPSLLCPSARLSVSLLALLLAAPAVAQAPGSAFVGTWEGRLVLGPAALRVVFHVDDGPDGLRVSGDSPDQGAYGIAGAETAVSGDTLRFALPSVMARVTLVRDAPEAATATLVQGGQALPSFRVTRRAAGAAAPAEPAAALAPYVGFWEGELALGANTLTLVMRLAPGPHPDTLRASLDVPAQGGFDLPTAGGTLGPEARLVVRMPLIGARFDGRLAGMDVLEGRFEQGGASLPLTLGRVTQARADAYRTEAPPRPQTPQAPFPYAEEEVRIASAPGVVLAGTLTRPEGAGPFPGVVLVTGSGPQDRDQTIFGHRPFAVIADHLTRAGFAVLRYDDRGTAASTGDFAAATLDDLTADAAAALAWLAARPDVTRVGVLGHSEGGYVALRLAARGAPSFAVSLAGPAVAGAAVYAEQHRLLARAAGVSEAGADAYGRAVAALAARVTAPLPGADEAAQRATAEAAFREALAAVPEADRALLGLSDGSPVPDQLLDFVFAPGVRSFLAYDPASDLAALGVPMLAVYGSRDLQVPAAQSVPVMRTALAGTPGAGVLVFDEANHLFQEAQTGSVDEYRQIQETIMPAVLQAVERWLRAQAEG
ncbi:MAG: alpha/beta hydrolase family protein [Rubricoccaceae bacterium]